MNEHTGHYDYDPNQSPIAQAYAHVYQAYIIEVARVLNTTNYSALVEIDKKREETRGDAVHCDTD